MTTTWDDHDWQSARIQVGAAFINNWWVKMGVGYGFATDPGCHTTRNKTDHLLAQLTDRIVFQSQGPRVICGDFNQHIDALRQFSVWRAHGFVEIQEMALQRWGRPVMPTYQSKTITDYVWVSRELWPHIIGVHIDETIFTDHAALWAEVAPLPSPKPIPVWRKPMSLPWDEIGECHVDPENAPITDEDSNTAIRNLMKELECAVDTTLKETGGSLLPQQRGRCLTVEPKIKKNVVAPLRRSRAGEFQITFMGEQWQHVQWCRQLRRLQSLVRINSSNKDGAHIMKHRQSLWISIRRAPGFPHGFLAFWKCLSSQQPTLPQSLPCLPPDSDTASKVFEAFKVEFTRLENLLIKERLHRAKERRREDNNVIFKDVSKPRAMPVQSIVEETTSQVLDVSGDGLTITCDKPWPDDGQPLFGPHGTLEFVEREGRVLKFSKPTSLEVGDSVRQEVYTGDVHEVFRAFSKFWEQMWMRNADDDMSKWDTFMRTVSTEVPAAPSVMPYEPLTTDQWIQAVQKKRPNTAAGPDGEHATSIN